MAAPRIHELARDQVLSLWSIDRRERIDRVYSVDAGELVLRDEHHEVRGWPPGEPERDIPILLDCFDRGGSFYGAFEGTRLVGACVLESRFIGLARDQLQLKFLYVGRDQRGRGLGTALFERAVERARELGARRLYVSSAPSENTVRFYLARGCALAGEVDAALFQLEPEDVHLDFEIPAPKAERRDEARPSLPTLATERLVLRPFRPSDAPRVTELLDDPHVSATLEGIPYPYREEYADYWIPLHVPLFERSRELHLAIELRSPPALVGAVALLSSEQQRPPQLGYWLGRRYWGRGIVTKAMAELLRHAGAELGVEAVAARCMVDNPASLRVLAKLGLVRVGPSEPIIKEGRRCQVDLFRGELDVDRCVG